MYLRNLDASQIENLYTFFLKFKQRSTHFEVHFLQFYALSQGIRITLYWGVIVFKTNLGCPMLMRNKSVSTMAGGFCW